MGTVISVVLGLFCFIVVCGLAGTVARTKRELETTKTALYQSYRKHSEATWVSPQSHFSRTMREVEDKTTFPHTNGTETPGMLVVSYGTKRVTLNFPYKIEELPLIAVTSAYKGQYLKALTHILSDEQMSALITSGMTTKFLNDRVAPRVLQNIGLIEQSSQNKPLSINHYVQGELDRTPGLVGFCMPNY